MYTAVAFLWTLQSLSASMNACFLYSTGVYCAIADAKHEFMLPLKIRSEWRTRI